MRIVYVGRKELKTDNVAQTGLAWTRGQILDVPDEVKAKKLLEHPLVWADADKEYTLTPELKAVEPMSRVEFTPAEPTSLRARFSLEPVVIQVPNEVFAQLQDKKLIAVFMTAEDADAFAEWKARGPDDTAPKNTGPQVDISKMDKRSREYKQWAASQKGLEKQVA